VSGCTELTELHCQYNALTALNVTGCNKLMLLACNNNQLTFSALPLLSSLPSLPVGFYSYGNQGTVPISLDSGHIVDLSREYLDGTTTYTWKRGAEILLLETHFTAENGVFTFFGLKPGDVVHCEMTNTLFSGLTLKTSNVTIAANAHDWDKVEAAKANNGLKDEHVTWH